MDKPSHKVIQIDPKLLQYFQHDKKYKQAICLKCKRVFQVKDESQVYYLQRHLKIKHKIIMNESDLITSIKKNRTPQPPSFIKKQKSIFQKYSAKCLQYNWISYFNENVPSDDEDYLNQTNYGFNQKWYYHGTQFTDRLKYLQYKRYSTQCKKRIEQFIGKYMKQKKYQNIENKYRQLSNSVQCVPKQILEYTKFQIFRAVDFNVYKIFENKQQYDRIINKAQRQAIQTIYKNIPKNNKKRKSQIKSYLANFSSQFLFKNLLKYGYNIYATHDIRNRFYGFIHHSMKIAYKQYGQVIYVNTEIIDGLNVCIFSCQDNYAYLKIVGICIYEHYDINMIKNIFNFFIHICQQKLPISIFLIGQSMKYSQQLNKLFMGQNFRTKILNLRKSKNLSNSDESRYIYRGVIQVEQINQWSLLKFIRQGLLKIKKNQLTIQNFVIVIPDVQLITYHLNELQSIKSQLKLSNKTLCNQQNKLVSYKIQKILKYQQQKSYKKCFHCLITNSSLYVYQTKVNLDQIHELQYACNVFTIFFNHIEDRWICNCGMIFQRGIPCCHLIYTLALFGSNYDLYINSRWFV